MVEYTCIVSMNSFKILITWVPSQDINTPLGFLRHLTTILRMGPGGLFSAAVVCSSWTVVNSSWAYSYLERVVYCASIANNPTTLTMMPCISTRWIFTSPVLPQEVQAGEQWNALWAISGWVVKLYPDIYCNPCVCILICWILLVTSKHTVSLIDCRSLQYVLDANCMVSRVMG